MLTLEGITIQTPIGPVTFMTEMPIIPTPFGPITIEKKKEEVAPPAPVVAAAPVIGTLPIILIGLAAAGVVIYIITRKR